MVQLRAMIEDTMHKNEEEIEQLNKEFQSFKNEFEELMGKKKQMYGNCIECLDPNRPNIADLEELVRVLPQVEREIEQQIDTFQKKFAHILTERGRHDIETIQTLQRKFEELKKMFG